MINSGDIQTLFNSIYYPFPFTLSGRIFVHHEDNGDGIIVYNDIPPQPSGIVIIIHGWWGSMNSPIIVRYISLLRKRKCGIICISLKDHVDDYSLSKSIFSFQDISYIDNVLEYYIKRHNHITLMGFSFGANLVLRLSCLKMIDRIILISPVFDIKSAFAYIETKTIYRTILIKKWKTYLRKKQMAYPWLYNFSFSLNSNTINNIVSGFIAYIGFNTVEEYFIKNSITESHILTIETPMLIIHAQNDPIIPVSNLSYLENVLKRNRFINLHINEYGGHCPFCPKEISNWMKTELKNSIC